LRLEEQAERGVNELLKKIKICGIPYKITQGLISYAEGIISIKKDMPKKIKESVLYHEIIHGILTQIGYNDLSNDERLVQALTVAIYQMFDLKEGKKK
jgi:hypothetical protein